LIWIITAAAICLADQAAKYAVRSLIAYGDRIAVIDDFFYLTYHENTGAAWGIFKGGRFIFITITIILIAAMAFLIYRAKNRLFKTSLSFIIGGASGNLADRIISGRVGDFLDFRFGSYVYPSFNVGDMFIVVGTIMLSIYLLFIFKGSNLKEIGR